MAHGPAVDGYQKRYTGLGKLADRLIIRPITLKNPVRNMNDAGRAAGPKIVMEQRRGAGTINVIITQNRNPFAACDGLGNAARRGLHILQAEGIGQKLSQRRFEVILHAVGSNTSPRKYARQEISRAMPLRDRKRPGLAR